MPLNNCEISLILSIRTKNIFTKQIFKSLNLSFQGVNRRFVLSFKNEDVRKSYSNYYLRKVEIMIHGKNFFD